MQDWSLGGEDPLEEETAAHSSILAWEIPWIGQLVGYRTWDHKRVRYDWMTQQLAQQQNICWLGIETCIGTGELSQVTLILYIEKSVNYIHSDPHIPVRWKYRSAASMFNGKGKTHPWFFFWHPLEPLDIKTAKRVYPALTKLASFPLTSQLEIFT